MREASSAGRDTGHCCGVSRLMYLGQGGLILRFADTWKPFSLHQIISTRFAYGEEEVFNNVYIYLQKIEINSTTLSRICWPAKKVRWLRNPCAP